MSLALLLDRSMGTTERLQGVLTPELRYSQWHYEDALRKNLAGVQSWLDVGCGHRVLPPWRQEAERELVASVCYVAGVDSDSEAIGKHASIRNLAVADVGRLPFSDCSFDLVTANMVVEHLSDPRAQFREVARVLRPGGAFLFHTPNLRGYPALVSRFLSNSTKRLLAKLLEGRSEEDVYPTHYRANTYEAIESAAIGAGLRVEAVDYHCSTPILGLIPALAALELLYIRRLLRNRNSYLHRPVLICLLRKPGRT